MKKSLATLLSFLTAIVFAAATDAPSIIPQPQKMELRNGEFLLRPDTKVFADKNSRQTATQLAERLRKSTGYPLKLKSHSRLETSAGILLTTRDANTNLGAEGYELDASANSVVIRAPTQAGLFYGAQTLMQLLSPDIFSTNVVTKAEWPVPCVHIEDQPRFKWRGFMLDVSRHFYNKAEVERILDEMVLYKLNTFHWHLVDDQGWRIEIKKYPRLTQIGAWRKQSDLPRANDGTTAHPAWMAPAADKFGPDGRYGGFYTQKDIREVVAYAAARHITVVPEIEMPGHSGAAVAAYPELGCSDVTNSSADFVRAGIHNGIYCPANEQTFKFLDDVLREVFDLFPGQYIHIGGDEVRTNYWHQSPECQALMQREGLKNEYELQSWFIKRMEKFINAHGRTLIGWSEILKGGLATNAVVMDWIGGGQEAAEAGHDAVMTPNTYCYINYCQSTNREAEPRAQGGFLSLRKVYSFEPIPTNLPPQFQSHILGAQGNLWMEWIASVPHVEYMLFPRLCALAEVVWSPAPQGATRNWDDFVRRLSVNERRLDELGINYHRGYSEPLNARRTEATNREPARITTDYIDAKVSLDYPGFEGLSVDSLGKEHFPLVTIEPPAQVQPARAHRRGARVEYRKPGAASSGPPRWAIEVGTNEIVMESHWSADDPPEPLVLNVNNSICHVTLLGAIDTNGATRAPAAASEWNAAHPDTNISVLLPAILHFPDQGSFSISADAPGVKSLGYFAPNRQTKIIQITFPAATQQNPVIKYRWQVVAIHPDITADNSDARFDGFRRDWLNILQLSPHWRALANHASSDTCGFCYYEYADIALQTPPLADGVAALDMVRQTLDRIIAGGNAYGMPGYGFGSFPEYSSDTLPSFLIAAEDYVQGSNDKVWLAANYDHLKNWADKMLSTDNDGNGLIEYNSVSGNSGSWPQRLKYRPSNWWDTIGFAHEDAYANALAYRALRGLEELARQSNHSDDEARYRVAADKLKEDYFSTFYNPATGVLAGWRSADGQLHDYYFLFVNGIAIHYGLVPADKANSIMDHLLAKMKEVGYTRFDLGLPGNLISVAKKDYVDHNPRFGGGTNEDNSDGFQIYENGGATASFAYFTLAALYDLGRIEDGDRILLPMLDGFAKGGFQGFCDNKMSKDWKTWDGNCHGYEGFLTDNYYALLAVLDREAAIKRAGRMASQIKFQ